MPRAPRPESVTSESSALSSIGSNITQYLNKRQLRPSADTTPASLVASGEGTPAAPTSKPHQHRRYRPSAEAPDNFKEQTQILLEEGIYHLAIQSLQTNLFSRSYHPADTPWWVAPPAHVAFLGTLVIHPEHTTWARTDNQRIVAARAHQYLLDVLRTVGPVDGHFKAAFAFRDRSSRAEKRQRRRRRHSPTNDDAGGSDADAGDDDDDLLAAPLANEDGLWNRVPDFWTMLGWAFACAAAHADRWVHWKLWVELLLDVLERDVQERKRLDEERGDGSFAMLKESIMVSYIGTHPLGYVLRALFAFIDGNSHSYKEIWPKETLTPTASNKRKRDVKVDLEHDEFGDWYDPEDDFMEDGGELDANDLPRTKPRQRRGAGGATKRQPPPLVACPLLEETLPIRRRIFALISRVCYELSEDEAPFAVFDLYERFAEHVRDLPLDVFPHFVWSDTPVEPSIYVTLVRHVLANLLPPGIVKPSDVDEETEAKGYVSGVILERCFLPYAANSVVADNAKLAVVLWELLSYMWQDPSIGLELTPGMRKAIETGLETREKKSKMKNEAPPRSVLEPAWLEKMLESIEKDRYAPASVLRLAHLKFRFLLEKSEKRDRFGDNGYLEADFLGWK